MTETTKKIRTRFAPSPTGFLHVGGLRTALFAYLWAKHNGGDFLLRIEDTDQARFIDGAIEKLVSVLTGMGIVYDEGVVVESGEILDKGDHGPYLQSNRLEIYQKYSKELVEAGHAYYCFCDEQRLTELRKEQEALKQPTRYDRKCRSLSKEEVQNNFDNAMAYVIRQAIPEEGQTTIHDLVYGDIVWENKLLDDQVLMKSDGFPTYHLAVVIDDHLMEISHVIRGEEWIPSTPKHILLYKSFGWEQPQFAHLPLLLNKDRSKLSKRQGDVSVEDFLAKGYLKEALINFVALLGWNPKTDQEIFNLQELIEQFELSKVNKSGPIFDIEKLDWFNNLYIRKMSNAEIVTAVLPFLKADGLIVDELQSKNGKKITQEFLESIIEIEKERMKKFSEIGERTAYFFEQPKYNPELLIWKKANLVQTKENLSNLIDFIQNLSDSDFNSVLEIETKVKEFIAQNNLDNGSVLWPLRVALSGLEKSPSPFELLYVLFIGYGKFEILQRIEIALKLLT
ncbi:MAG: gltX [Candidatus Doudnabacteria bacterium]|nr:gltX [Candidatus Doudnabacteria bacterium]